MSRTVTSTTTRLGKPLVTTPRPITWDGHMTDLLGMLNVASQQSDMWSPVKLCFWGMHRNDRTKLVQAKDVKPGPGMVYCRLTREFPASAVHHRIVGIQIVHNSTVKSTATGEVRIVLLGSFVEDCIPDGRFPYIKAGRPFGVIFNPDIVWAQSTLALPAPGSGAETLRELSGLSSTLTSQQIGFGTLRLINTCSIDSAFPRIV